MSVDICPRDGWHYVVAEDLKQGDTTRHGVITSSHYSGKSNLVVIRYAHRTDYKHPRSPIEVKREQ